MKKCELCKTEFDSRWVYCSNECTEEAAKRTKRELEITQKLNEVERLKYQNEILRLERIASQEEITEIPFIQKPYEGKLMDIKELVDESGDRIDNKVSDDY